MYRRIKKHIHCDKKHIHCDKKHICCDVKTHLLRREDREMDTVREGKEVKKHKKCEKRHTRLTCVSFRDIVRLQWDGHRRIE